MSTHGSIGDRTWRRLPTWLIVFFSVVLAWFPLCGRYTFIYDDFYLACLLDDGLIPYFVNAYEREGLWRILGLLAISLSLQSAPLFFVAVTLIHTVACCLFLEISTALFRKRILALILTLVMAVYPWSHQCFWWASAIHFPLSALPLLLSILLFAKRYRRANTQLEGFCVTSLLATTSVLVFEGVAFASMVAGSFLWLQGRSCFPSTIISRMRTYYSAWGPIVAGGLCLVGISCSQPPHAWKQLEFNPETFISSIYYQYTNFLALAPLMSSEGRAFMFWNWQPLHFGVAATLLLSLYWLVKRGGMPTRWGEPTLIHWIVPYLFLLLMALGAAYALGGGFSLDARKKYPFIPVLLWIVAAFVSSITDRVRAHIPRGIDHVGFAGMAVVLFTGVAATWTTLGLVRYELRRVDSLASYIRNERIQGDIQLESSIDAYALWPSMRSQIGWRLDDTDFLATAAGVSDLRHVESDSGNDSPVRLFYAPETAKWTTLPPFQRTESASAN